MSRKGECARCGGACGYRWPDSLMAHGHLCTICRGSRSRACVRTYTVPDSRTPPFDAGWVTEGGSYVHRDRPEARKRGERDLRIVVCVQHRAAYRLQC